MKYLFIFIALATTFTSWSQDAYGRNYGLRETEFYYNKHIELGPDDVDYTIKTIGSPYANPDFLPGILMTTDSVIHKNIYLRYNVHKNEMEVKTSDDEESEIFSLLKSPDFYVQIKDKVYEFVPLNGKIEGGTYFEILYSGDHVDLYKNQTKKYSPPERARTSLQGDVPQRFDDLNRYYIVTNEGVLYEVPSSRKKILDIFKAKRNELEKHTKKNKLNFNDESDLLKLIRYYDTLL